MIFEACVDTSDESFEMGKLVVVRPRLFVRSFLFASIVCRVAPEELRTRQFDGWLGAVDICELFSWREYCGRTALGYFFATAH